MMQPLREGTQVSDTVAAHGDPTGRWESQVPPQCLVTLSFYLRDSAGQPPFTFGTRGYAGLLQSRIRP